MSDSMTVHRLSDLLDSHFSGPSPTCIERNIRGNEWGVLKTTCSTTKGWNWRAHKVLPPAFWNLTRLEVKSGDSIITKAGPRHRVGVASFVDFVPPRIIPSGKMICLRPNPERVLPAYLALALSDSRTQRYLDQRTTGMAESQVNFENNALLGAPVWLPERDEQESIFEALTGPTAAVTSLERLIEKRQAIKQGMMQQLLTGKTRLPGFTGDWIDLDVAENSHLKARIGWQGLSVGEYRDVGEYGLIGGTNFANGRVDWSSTPFVDKWRFDQDSKIQVRNGDVLITKDGSIGKVAFVEDLPGPSTLNSGVFVLRPKNQAYDSGFLYFLFRSPAFDDFVSRLSAGSTISHLYQRDLAKLRFDVPPTLAEQKAISTALFDVDAELTLLQKRLESTRNIKRGMMQELLTGRTRLSPVGV